MPDGEPLAAPLSVREDFNMITGTGLGFGEGIITGAIIDYDDFIDNIYGGKFFVDRADAAVDFPLFVKGRHNDGKFNRMVGHEEQLINILCALQAKSPSNNGAIDA